ncbi:unnamed protein product [Arabidopsis thaliana]|uniref:Uncharacterized protein n=1 Tax=Arabidopsis thaliana TaxID=3702 RepID=A0A5S9Y885_ARATH|nr:unnamed protein product [Arabidopsis thaliana]
MKSLLLVAAGDRMANPSQFEGSMMLPLCPNMFQQQLNIIDFNQQQPLNPNTFHKQCNINEFNQQQPLDLKMFQQQFNINQFNKQHRNQDFYGQLKGS